MARPEAPTPVFDPHDDIDVPLDADPDPPPESTAAAATAMSAGLIAPPAEAAPPTEAQPTAQSSAWADAEPVAATAPPEVAPSSTTFRTNAAHESTVDTAWIPVVADAPAEAVNASGGDRPERPTADPRQAEAAWPSGETQPQASSPSEEARQAEAAWPVGEAQEPNASSPTEEAQHTKAAWQDREPGEQEPANAGERAAGERAAGQTAEAQQHSGAPSPSAPPAKHGPGGMVAGAAAAVGAVAAAAVAAVRKAGKSDQDPKDSNAAVADETPATEDSIGADDIPGPAGTPEAEGTPAAMDALDEPIGQTHPHGSPWADLAGTPEPDRHADEVITAYPSARPGPAGAIYGVGITVLVTDLDRSVAFYRDILGFFEIDSGDGSAVLASGDTRLVLRAVHGLTSEAGRLIYLNLEVGDIEAVFKELRAKGVAFVHAPRPVNRGGRLELWSASFRDPDDHNIAITQWRAVR
jgi:catechol 2,3-dioxygenase-like lactoylglutathione lyase family enzyme